MSNIVFAKQTKAPEIRCIFNALGEGTSKTMAEYAGYPHYAFVQDFETGLNPQDVSLWFKNNWHYSLYLTIVYLVVIFALREYMKNRKPVQVRQALIIWNASLAVFSICGMSRSLPELLYVLKNYGVEHSICDNTVNSVTLFWCVAFAFSKAFELLDTVFIVLRKRQLTVLHVSHHVLMFVFLFFFADDMPAIGRWCVSLNYSVHAFMYSYFALKSAKFDLSLNISMIMTIVQIVQFLMGVLVVIFVLRAIFLSRPCATKMPEAIVALLFTLYLFYMFVKFFLQKYKFVNSK